jgi:hypothetical protein
VARSKDRPSPPLYENRAVTDLKVAIEWSAILTAPQLSLHAPVVAINGSIERTFALSTTRCICSP